MECRSKAFAASQRSPKFTAQAIRRAYDIARKPVHYLNSVGNYAASVLVPAGLDKSVGLISTQVGKHESDRFRADESMQPVRFDGKTWVRFGDVLGLRDAPPGQ